MLCIKSVVLSNAETTKVEALHLKKPRAGAVKLLTLYTVKLYHANHKDSVLAFEAHNCLNKLLEIRLIKKALKRQFDQNTLVIYSL